MPDAVLITLITLIAFTLFVTGTPLMLIIGLWVIGMQLIFDFPLANVGSSMFEGLNSFALLAAPLFILTGDLISAGGIARRMSDFALAILGWVRGGLGMASLGACGMFAAISGSNAATTATIGSITYPTMVKQGYDKNFSAATAAAGGTVGIIIPPSILFIVYGYLISLPISELFLAGIIPGILMVGVMMVACYIVSRRRTYGEIIPFELEKLRKTFPGASIGIIAIFIVLGGIYAGIFSPTEASAVTVVYCLLAGLFVTRETKWKALPDIFFRSAIIIGIIVPLVAVSIMMQEILAVIGAKEFIEGLLTGLGGYYTILFVMMGMVLAAGTILESVPNTIILAPILAPIAVTIGVDPFHFAVIFLIGDAIGFITPPYGLNLYVASGITGLPYFQIVRQVLPYLFSLIFIWVVIALIPELSTWLVQFAGLGGAGLRN
ncbi:MAG: TRAP transporter large permease [Rhodospirillaceae bacterium]|nr:TRAP transporter large permease [Rhodospirillaceae bacterium]MDD9925269.1 TRAP transporter large permease [Rhodospirillaceae bacterium]